MSKGRFASRTAFEALAVSSGEESEEELSPELAPIPLPSSVQEPVKLSKTALKKAAKAARLEKEKSRAQRREGSTASNSLSDAASSSPSGSVANPVKVLPVEDIAPPAPTDEPVITPPQASEPPTLITPEVPRDIPTLMKSPPPPPEKTDPPPSVPILSQPPQQLSNTSGAYAPQLDKSPAQNNDAVLDAEHVKKRQNAFERALWTVIMIGTFLGLLLLGHAYMILLVMLCQTLVYREVTALFSLKNATLENNDFETKKVKDPWSKTLNWYFFAVTNYFLYGESIIYYFKHVVFTDSNLLPFATNHRIISFTLYTIGFVGFVMSLKKGYLKQQFGMFCWVHMSLLLIVVSSHFIVNNILEGLIWFWVPAFLVICNDIFAYIWGVTIGRTPLIKLSPKKTVEGFIGAFWSTIVFGILWGTYFMRFNYMICPVHDLGVSAWSAVECVPNPIFVWTEWTIWAPLANVLSTALGRSITTIPYAPYQYHLLFMSCFASLVAPFGGFFASGFKRAFNIKDFGHSIPGHGGMTDRMDCQFLMGVFTYVYYSSLIREHHVTVGSILQTIVSGLTIDEQLEVIVDLKRYLEGQNIHVPC